MSLNTTTLSAACAVNDTQLSLTSTTGVTAPNFPVGPACYIIVEAELMLVSAFSGVSGSAVGVVRGQGGTKQVAHGNTAPVLIFLATDFGSIYNLGYDLQHPFNASFGLSVGAPVASATTISPSVWGRGTCFHVTGTTTIQTITVPSSVLQTEITIIFDGACSWGNSGNIAIGSSGTQTTTFVTFLYDAKAAKWYPSKISA